MNNRAIAAKRVPLIAALGLALAVLSGVAFSVLPTPLDVPALRWLMAFVGIVVIGTGVFLATRPLRETLWAWCILAVLLLGSVWKTYSYYDHSTEPSFWTDKTELIWVSSDLMIAGARWIAAAVLVVAMTIVLSMFLTRPPVSPEEPLPANADRRALRLALAVGVATLFASLLRVTIGIGLLGTTTEHLPLRLDSVLNRFVTDLAPGLLLLAFWIVDRCQNRSGTWIVGVLILAQGIVFAVTSTSRLGIAQYTLPVVFLWLLTGRISRRRWSIIAMGAVLSVLLVPFLTDLRIARLNSTEGMVADIRTALDMTSERFTEEGAGAVVTQSADHLATRFIGAEGVWYALTDRPEQFSPARMFDLVFAERVGRWYTAEVVGVTRPGDFRAPGIIGVSMLLAGSPVAVMALLGMYVVGMASLWNWLSTFRTWPVALALWAKVLLIFTSEGTLLAQNIVSALGVAVVCEWSYRAFLRRESPPPSDARPPEPIASPATMRP